MNLTTVLVAVVTALLSGGLITAIVSLKKAPVERDSIVVTGAESAVQSLERSLAAESARCERLQSENERLATENGRLHAIVAQKDHRIALLESRLDEVQNLVDQLRQEIHEIREMPEG